jgi:hypothetical protein
MIKVQNLVDSILYKDSHHPDLGVSHKSTSSVIHSVFSESIHKRSFNFIDVGIMHIYNFGLNATINSGWRLFHFDKYGHQYIIVFFKIVMHLVEESYSSGNSFVQENICFFHVFFGFFLAIEHKQLESRLGISVLACCKKILFCLI